MTTFDRDFTANDRLMGRLTLIPGAVLRYSEKGISLTATSPDTYRPTVMDWPYETEWPIKGEEILAIGAILLATLVGKVDHKGFDEFDYQGVVNWLTDNGHGRLAKAVAESFQW